MKVFLVERTDIKRTDISTYREVYSMVVIAKDSRHAERKARWSSEDYRKAPLKVTEVDIDTEQVVLVAMTSA